MLRQLDRLFLITHFIPPCASARLFSGRCWFEYRKARFVPIIQESGKAGIRERMLEEHLHNLERHRADVRACFNRLNDVKWVANGGNENFAATFRPVSNHVRTGAGARTIECG